MSRFAPLYAGLLVVVLVFAVTRLFDPDTPAMAAAGLLLCTAGPLGFILTARRRAGNQRRHPVLVSSLSGLGCVMIMVSIQRFGDEHSFLLSLALLVLVGWMVYQRKAWRGPPGKDRSGRGD